MTEPVTKRLNHQENDSWTYNNDLQERKKTRKRKRNSKNVCKRLRKQVATSTFFITFKIAAERTFRQSLLRFLANKWIDGLNVF